MSFSVIIPSRNAANLVPCVEAVRKHEPGVRIIVIDDGVDWKAVTFKHTYEDSVLPGPKPFVFSKNCNLGISYAGADDVILLNDDALLTTPGGFTRLSRAAEEHPEYGIISATTNCTGTACQYQSPGGGFREHPSGHICFVCVYIPRATVERVGLLDERFTAYGWEDNDYCRRVRNAGLKIGIFDGCFVDHKSLHSTFRGDPTAPGNIAPGREIYRAKWGDLA